MATRPQTAPTAIPTADGFFFLTQSVSIQLTAAPAAAKFVTTSAFTARAFAARALPALNPNHPNQRTEAPRITYGMLFGRLSKRSTPFRRPITSAAATAETPAVGSGPDFVQPKIGQAPDELVEGRPQRERVSPEGPHEADDREDGEALGDRRDEVLPPDEPAVEEAQRGRHDHDEGGRRDNPRHVSGVQRHFPRSTELDGRQGTELGV